MSDQFSRTRLLLGEQAMKKLEASRVAVFGIGGVGGYVCEALARSGIGAIDLVDDDKVCITNLNRQIIAARSTLGRYKVDVMRERMLDINPEIRVKVYKCFFLPENALDFPFASYDYVVDAVDTVTAKLALAEAAEKAGIPIISCMGAGNKLDAAGFRVADIYDTKVCPLAKVMRRELKIRGIKKLKVVYSEEAPLTSHADTLSEEDNLGEEMVGDSASDSASEQEASSHDTKRRRIPGSVAFVPSVAGLILAGEVVKDLCRVETKSREG